MTASEGKKKAKGTKDRQWNMMISRAEPSGSPPTLCSALSVSDEWEMLQGENWESGSWMTRDKTKPRLCSAETPCCISGVLGVREVLNPSGLVSLVLFQWRAQSARWSALIKNNKKFKNREKFKFLMQSPDRRDHTPSLKLGVTLVLQQIGVSTCLLAYGPPTWPTASASLQGHTLLTLLHLSVLCSVLWIAQPWRRTWHCS